MAVLSSDIARKRNCAAIPARFPAESSNLAYPSVLASARFTAVNGSDSGVQIAKPTSVVSNS